MKVLCIPDLHIPFENKQALDFVLEMVKKHRPQQIIQMGDFADFYGFNMYGRDPEAITINDEIAELNEKVRLWEKYFPKMRVLTGNHENRLYRKLNMSDLSSSIVKSLEDIVGLENIKYENVIEIDNVIFTHGTGSGGMYHAKNLAEKIGKSVVAGHTHSNLLAHYMNYNGNLRVGVNTGALIDDDSRVFAYGAGFLRKAIPAITIIDTITLNVIFERLI